MTDPTFFETLQLDDGTEVTVKFTQGPVYPAIRPTWDDPGSPAEGGEIEIIDIFGGDGVSVAVSDATRERFYDELYRMPPHEQEPDWDSIIEQRREDRELARDDMDW
jgi:hypothetical protein